MSKTKILNVRIEADLKKKAKRLAEQDGRTLSNWVTRLIQEEVQHASTTSPEILAAAETRETRRSGDRDKSKK